MKTMKFLPSVCVLLAIVLVMGALNVGLGLVTGDIIAENESARATGALSAVLPGGGVFEAVDLTTLSDIPETVTAIYKETAGLGYVVQCSTTKGYTGDAIVLTFGVGADGVIAGIQLDAYPESKDFGAEYPATFVGQNSTLADVQIVAGVTFSSVAFRDAVADGFAALNANGLVAEAEKGPQQILTELLGTVHTGLSQAGNLKADELEVSGSMVKAWKAQNESGFAYIMKEGDSLYLAVANNKANVAVFDVDGNDVTADHPALAEEAATHAAANAKVQTDKEIAKFKAMCGADAKELPMDGVFSSVTGVYDLGGGKTGIVARSYGYEIMGVYYILDSNGAIVQMTADEFIFHKEYFAQFDSSWSEPDYKSGFEGLTVDTYTGEEAVIATATMTSNGVKDATRDIFAAFQVLKGGA